MSSLYAIYTYVRLDMLQHSFFMAVTLYVTFCNLGDWHQKKQYCNSRTPHPWKAAIYGQFVSFLALPRPPADRFPVNSTWLTVQNSLDNPEARLPPVDSKTGLYISIVAHYAQHHTALNGEVLPKAYRKYTESPWNTDPHILHVRGCRVWLARLHITDTCTVVVPSVRRGVACAVAKS